MKTTETIRTKNLNTDISSSSQLQTTHKPLEK